MGFGDQIQVVRVSINTSICCSILPAPIYNQSFLPSFPPSILLNVCIYVCMCTCVYVYICVYVCMCIYVNLSVLAPHTHTAITPTCWALSLAHMTCLKPSYMCFSVAAVAFLYALLNPAYWVQFFPTWVRSRNLQTLLPSLWCNYLKHLATSRVGSKTML